MRDCARLLRQFASTFRAPSALTRRRRRTAHYPAADTSSCSHTATLAQRAAGSTSSVHTTVRTTRCARSEAFRARAAGMPLDLSHPRYLAPFPAAPAAADQHRRRAVHLKLTEDVLKQLLDSVTAPPPKGADAADQAIRINLAGPNPVRLHPCSRRNHTYKRDDS